MCPSQAHCQLPPREPPALWHSGAGWGWHWHSQAPPVLGRGCGAAPGTQGAPALPTSARDTPAPSRPFTGVSSLAAHALLIHRGLHPQRPPCFPRAVASWAGLVRGPCALLLVAAGSCWPGTGPLEPWERTGGSKQGPNVNGGTGGARVSMHAVCRHTRVPGLGHLCCTWGAGVLARVHPYPMRGPPPTPALGHFLLRQNCWFFLLINLTRNLMLGSDFPLPR